MALAGRPLAKNPKESLKGWEVPLGLKDNQGFGSAEIAEAVEGFARAAKMNNEHFLFKAEPDLVDENLAKVLHKFGTKAVAYWRNNVLDWEVCMVRDCFAWQKNLGYPVYAES